MNASTDQRHLTISLMGFFVQSEAPGLHKEADQPDGLLCAVRGTRAVRVESQAPTGVPCVGSLVCTA